MRTKSVRGVEVVDQTGATIGTIEDIDLKKDGQYSVIVKGEVDPEKIIASVKEGLYVMTTGAFGFDGNTGDYSYEAAGRWIVDGALASPVHEITIASNSLDMLAAVQMVGNDLRFRGTINSPTIKIGEMSVSGRAE